MKSDLHWRDLVPIRRSMVICGAASLLALILALAAHLRLDAGRQAWQQMQQHLHSARQQLSALRTEETEYQFQLQRYRQRVPAGGAKLAPRLLWLSELRQAAARHHVTTLDYELSAQGSGNGAPGNPQLRAHRMNLRLHLLHDEDLFSLLAELRTRSKAMLRIRSCRLERLPPEEAEAVVASLSSQCDFDWLSAQEAS